jgi:hypothetical protein
MSDLYKEAFPAGTDSLHRRPNVPRRFLHQNAAIDFKSVTKNHAARYNIIRGGGMGERLKPAVLKN